MRSLGLALCAVVAVVLQGTILYEALPGGVTLDLALLFSLCIGWRHGERAGALLGLWSGALLGVAMGGNLTVPLAILYGLMGWCAALLKPLPPPFLGAGAAASLTGLESVIVRTPMQAGVLPWIMLWHGLTLTFLVWATRTPQEKHQQKLLKQQKGKRKWKAADSAFLASAV